MMHIDNFQDFIKAHADAAGMTREEFMAVLMSENTTIQEGLSKSAIKKQIKIIDKQIEDEEGGDGEPLTSETLQDLERERERLLALIESVVTEAKNTIGLAFKEEQDYLDFKEFVAEQPRGAIRKNIGFDSKTKSWNVEMDVKVLDSIYGEGTPSDKKSGWYGGLPDDFESVIIESVVTEEVVYNLSLIHI